MRFSCTELERLLMEGGRARGVPRGYAKEFARTGVWCECVFPGFLERMYAPHVRWFETDESVLDRRSTSVVRKASCGGCVVDCEGCLWWECGAGILDWAIGETRNVRRICLVAANVNDVESVLCALETHCSAGANCWALIERQDGADKLSTREVGSGNEETAYRDQWIPGSMGERGTEASETFGVLDEWLEEARALSLGEDRWGIAILVEKGELVGCHEELGHADQKTCIWWRDESEKTRVIDGEICRTRLARSARKGIGVSPGVFETVVSRALEFRVTATARSRTQAG